MQGCRWFTALLLGGVGLASCVALAAGQRPESQPPGVPPGLRVIASSGSGHAPAPREPDTVRQAPGLLPIDAAALPVVKVQTTASDGETIVRVSAGRPVGATADVRQVVASPTVAPGLCLEKRGPAAWVAGQDARYEIVVRNPGAQTLTHVHVEDEVPAGVVFLAAEPAAQLQGARLAWDLDQLEPGAERRLGVTIHASEAGQLRATATATFTATATLQAPVAPNSLNLRLQGPEQVARGEKVYFEVWVQNAGTVPFQRVLLRDQLAAGLRHPRGRVVLSEVGALDPGEIRMIPVVVVATATGRQASEVTVTAEGTEAVQRTAVLVTEPKMAESPKVPAPPPAPLATSVVAPIQPLLTAGDPVLRFEIAEPLEDLRPDAEVEYRIRLSNPRDTAATNVGMEILLASGLEVVKADGPVGNCLRAQRVLYEPLLQLAGRETVEFHLRLRGTRPGAFKLTLAAGCDQATTSVYRDLVVQVAPLAATAAGTDQEINKRK